MNESTLSPAAQIAEAREELDEHGRLSEAHARKLLAIIDGLQVEIATPSSATATNRNG